MSVVVKQAEDIDAPAAATAAPAATEVPAERWPAPPMALSAEQMQAREKLQCATNLIAEALEALRRGDPVAASQLVGRGSDHVGSALYYLRLVLSRVYGPQSVGDLQR